MFIQLNCRHVSVLFTTGVNESGDTQWKDYRSAKESARAWCPAGGEPALPGEIADVLNSHPEFQGAVIEAATPEERVPFENRK